MAYGRGGRRHRRGFAGAFGVDIGDAPRFARYAALGQAVVVCVTQDAVISWLCGHAFCASDR
jgi:hypothetical protein